jgi:hypothetical protein
MTRHRYGVKIYTYDWHTWFGMTPAAVADWLLDHGFSFAFVANQIAPLPASAVGTRRRPGIPPAADLDHLLRDALQAAGIEYIATSSVFFDLEFAAAHPDAIPVDAGGQRAEKIDWYEGLCPTHAGLIASHAAGIERVVAGLEPDGVHLQFIRFPGFWEDSCAGTGLPGPAEFCFCPRCVAAFAGWLGEVPPSEPAAWIAANHREAWTRWKCERIATVATELVAAARAVRPQTTLALNTLTSLDGHREAVFGQSIQQLAAVTDQFEVMAYHQILVRDAAWVGDACRQVKAASDRDVICTLQVAPEYADPEAAPLHRRVPRRPEISDAEFQDLLDASAASADATMVYVLRDLLEDDPAIRGKLHALRERAT